MNPSQMSAQSHPGHLSVCCCVTAGKLPYHPRCGGPGQHPPLLPAAPSPPSSSTQPSCQWHPPSHSQHFRPDEADFPCTTVFVLLPCSLSTQRSSQDIFCLLLFINMFANVQALKNCYSWSTVCCQIDTGKGMETSQENAGAGTKGGSHTHFHQSSCS